MGDFYELIKGIVGLAVINMGLILSLNLRFVRSGLQTQFKFVYCVYYISPSDDSYLYIFSGSRECITEPSCITFRNPSVSDLHQN